MNLHKNVTLVNTQGISTLSREPIIELVIKGSKYLASNAMSRSHFIIQI